ncbi:MAG: hypothetical protein WD077_13820 [Bacteroidia bacterium]
MVRYSLRKMIELKYVTRVRISLFPLRMIKENKRRQSPHIAVYKRFSRLPATVKFPENEFEGK